MTLSARPGSAQPGGSIQKPLPDSAPEGGEEPLPAGLYIVAGPIGNLADLSRRAAEWLRRAELVACEDSRVTAKLLRAAGSRRPMQSYHDHSSEALTEALLARAERESVALVSDAGTPLISDPGFPLVREARRRGIPVSTAPGPSAAIAALSISGLPASRFLFEGFLPAKAVARARAIAELAAIPATLIFYESGPRLADTLLELAKQLGAREAAVARELTKRHEEVVTGLLPDLAERYRDTTPRGEIVLLVGPPGAQEASGDAAVEQALLAALGSMKMGQAVASVASALGRPRDQVYQMALRLKGKV